MTQSRGILLGASILFLCLSTQARQAVFRAEKLAEMDKAIEQAIAEQKCPGGVLWLEHNGAVYHKAYGNRALVPKVERMTDDTIFDAASLTKVVACTPAMMLLVERGQVDLDATVQTYIPEFKGDGKEAITVRQLLTHTSGLRPDIETKTDWHGQHAAIQKASEEKLQAAPGTVLRYSDINLFVAGEIVQRVSKMPLEEFVKKNIYNPLGMKDTGYLPPQSKMKRIAPTEVVGGKPFRGIVHDPTSRHMGGVAGHAGLFFTASDLARYARMLLNEGSLNGTRIFKPETVRLMTSVQTPASISARRGLGWDIDSSYSGPRGKLFPLGSYGHTGWTGTSIWIDPYSRTFLIFLSNRNHPGETGNVGALRSRLATLAAEAITDFDFEHVPGALGPRAEAPAGPAADKPTKADSATKKTPAGNLRTLSGIDVLRRDNFAPLKGLRVALITNHTGHDRERNSTIDLLFNAPDVQLKLLFSPEHGIRGNFDEKVADSYDEDTGLPIHSLYGKANKPTSEQLTNIDALVFDIQDVGCRFYTYTSTMGLTLEAAGENHKKYFLLDRPDPIDGNDIEGPVRAAKGSFVAFHNVPLRYAMTLGELAQMFNEERNIHAELNVIKLENWRRDAWFDETGEPWSNPSPNMRNLNEAILYPGIGLLERALSVGRGTDTPFEIVGAPYIDDVKLAEELNGAGLHGVRFVPIQFTPKSSIHKEKLCSGVSILVTDRDRCNSVDVGLQIAKTLYRLYPDNFSLKKMSHLLLHDATLQALREDKPLGEIHALWEKDLQEFKARREKFLIYR
jgi:uncharacterized protein YbbC (DUF1343 family)/CubicO group peptidase (beta-lactamase class C family)